MEAKIFAAKLNGIHYIVSENSEEFNRYRFELTADEIIWSKYTPVRRAPDIVQRRRFEIGQHSSCHESSTCAQKPSLQYCSWIKTADREADIT